MNYNYLLLSLDNRAQFQLLRFNTHNNRIKIISKNKLLNFIALDNNKNLEIKKNSINTMMKLIRKIRNFNQFND